MTQPIPTPFVSVRDLKRFLAHLLATYPSSPQLDGGTKNNQRAYLFFYHTPACKQGVGRFIWKLHGDTTREAIERFVNGATLRFDNTKTQKGECLRLDTEQTANGWNCYRA